MKKFFATSISGYPAQKSAENTGNWPNPKFNFQYLNNRARGRGMPSLRAMQVCLTKKSPSLKLRGNFTTTKNIYKIVFLAYDLARPIQFSFTVKHLKNINRILN